MSTATVNIPSQVLTYANLAAFPVTGVLKTIYIAEDTEKTYRWNGSAYVEISQGSASGVTSFNSRTGAVTPQSGDYTKSDVGLGNVDNTSDANKPISTATQTALNNKQDLDSDLTAIAGLTPSNDDIIQRKSGSWINRTLAQLWTDLKDLSVTLTNKTLAVGSNSITGTASRVAQFGAGGSLESSSITTTQLSYLDATSSIQTQLDNRNTNIFKNNVQTDHTGTVAETLVLSYDVTGKFAANDLLMFACRALPNGANNKTVRIKVNTSASLVGASTLATYTFATTSILMQRNWWFANTLANIRVLSSTTSVASDAATAFNTTGINTVTHDFTGTTYILISCELAVNTDTISIFATELNRKR